MLDCSLLRIPVQLYGRSRYAPSSSSGSSGSVKSAGGNKKAGLSEDQLEEIREAFSLFDTNKTGTLDPRETKAAARALGLDLSKDDLRALLHQLNKDTSAASSSSTHTTPITVTLDEFITAMSTPLPARDSREEVEKVFRLFDEERSGYITFRALKRVVGELGEGLSEEEMQEMIDEADRDQDGKISFEEFYRVMRRRGENGLDDWDSDDD